MSVPTKPLCGYSGLGLMGQSHEMREGRDFPARCGCGAIVTVVDGRIPFHEPGVVGEATSAESKRVDELIESSSLGTPAAKAARDSVNEEEAQRIVDRARMTNPLEARDVVTEARQALADFGAAILADEDFEVPMSIAFALEALIRRTLPELVEEVERLRRLVKRDGAQR